MNEKNAKDEKKQNLENMQLNIAEGMQKVKRLNEFTGSMAEKTSKSINEFCEKEGLDRKVILLGIISEVVTYYEQEISGQLGLVFLLNFGIINKHGKALQGQINPISRQPIGLYR